jgi:hypothetical protein
VVVVVKSLIGRIILLSKMIQHTPITSPTPTKKEYVKS